MPCLIRAARPTDLEFIVESNMALAEETEHRELDRERVSAGVAAVLADGNKGRYFVADDGDGPVGQLLVTYEWSDWRCGCFWWIQSVYVEPAARGTGVFGELYRHVELLATREPEVCGVRLYVHEHNDAAAAIYRHLDLRATGYHVLQVDFYADADRER
jgi:GNAT superfamily N-acetyltransferase